MSKPKQTVTCFPWPDAMGRKCGVHDVVYTDVDIKGMFIDAVARGEPPNGRILKYCRTVYGAPLWAIIENGSTGVVSVYEMNIETKAPFEVCSLHPCILNKDWRKTRRPRRSPEYKAWLLERRWENR